MSLTLVVLNARWLDWLWLTQTTLPTKTEQTRAQSRFFRTEPLTLNLCCSLDYVRGNEYIIYFTDLCKPIETYIYARKKHPFASYSAEKHPNALNLRFQTYDKNQWTFFTNTTQASISALAIIFQI